MLENTPYIVVGYSGHAYEICNILQLCGTQIVEYCDVQEKSENLFKLKYLGRESEIDFGDDAVFIAIGENSLRCKIYDSVYGKVKFGKAYHQSADIGFISSLGSMVMLAPKTVINSLSTIGNEVIINNGAIVEHECTKGDFVHVAPGAVLLGNVSVGEGSFIGARSVVKQGAKIGKNCIVGAGTVVLDDIFNNTKVVIILQELYYKFKILKSIEQSNRFILTK